MASHAARLLVADDNKVNRLLLQRSLQLQGHHVSLAENGRVALEMLAREPFDLLLLDIAMPEMDGFQVLEHLAKDLRLRDLPVIVTSAVEGMDNVVRCIECGAEDYLPKPVNPVLLKARIGASLEKKRLRDQQKELVRRFATREVAEDLDASGFALGGHRVQATVMFSDIRGFTTMSELLPPEETIELLNTYYTLMFDAITGHGGIVNQMIGDGLMAIFGAPLVLADPCASAVRAAQEMLEMVALFNQEPHRRGHRFGGGDRRLHRHRPARDLHLCRRHREPGGPAGGAHQGGRAVAAVGRGDAGGARRGVRRRAARADGVQGQDHGGRGVRAPHGIVRPVRRRNCEGPRTRHRGRR
jgi:CheY-like chemotaxis protein